MQLNRKERYTIKDYRSWRDNRRWELIDGEPYCMAPAPNVSHQALVIQLGSMLMHYLSGKTCKAFVSPIDVYLSDDENDDTVVQPDVLVVCDHSKLRRYGIVGAPDILVEILSPTTAGRDFSVKLRLYQRYMVPEYWIVSPEERIIYRHILMTDGQYSVNPVTEGELTTPIFSEFKLDVATLFASLDGLPS